MLTSLQKREHLAGSGALILATILLVCHQYDFLPIYGIEKHARDLAAATNLAPEPDVSGFTIVIVDDESLVRLGERWPLARRTWAKAIDVIAGHQPKAVAIDAWFETAAPRHDVELALDLADRINESGARETPMGKALVRELERLATTMDGDRALMSAIAKAGTVILGSTCLPKLFDSMDQAATEPPRPMEGTGSKGYVPRNCDRLSANLAPLALAARSQAILNLPMDTDDRARRYGFLIRREERTYPSLALEALRVAHGDQWTERILAMEGNTAHPVLRPTSSFTEVRFSDLLEPNQNKDALDTLLKNKMVFIGASAEGVRDHFQTTLPGHTPGVYLHALAAANALDGTALRQTSGSRLGGTIVGLCIFAVLAIVGRRTHSAGWVFLGALGGLTAWLGTAAYLLTQGIWLPSAAFLLGIFCWSSAKLAAVYLSALHERRRAAHIRRVFQHYLAPEVVEELMSNPEKLTLGGERCEITAFFADMQGFTTLSEQLPPDALAALLNRCLGIMSDLIVAEGGIIDKYVGDAIVAMFGAPVNRPDHALRAARASLRCQQGIKEMAPWLAERDLPMITVRIGLNTGSVVVGNMGSEHRFDYTMLGDAVNYAARLESANKGYGTRVMVGQSTYEAIREEMFMRELDEFRARGKTETAPIYELMATHADVSEAQKELSTDYAAALSAYRAEDWAVAAARFAPLVEGGDGPSKVLLERVEKRVGPDADK